MVNFDSFVIDKFCYPPLKNSFDVAYLDACANILRDFGDELGKDILGFDGEAVAAMARAEVVVVTPTSTKVGLGANPFGPKHDLAFYLPLDIFMKGLTLLPHRFLFDSLAPHLTQIMAMVSDSYYEKNPIFFFKRLPYLKPDAFVDRCFRIPFSWTTEGSGRCLKKDKYEAGMAGIFVMRPKNFSAVLDYLRDTKDPYMSRSVDSRRGKVEMAQKKFYDKFFPSRLIPTPLIQGTPLHMIQLTLLDLNLNEKSQTN